MLIYNITAQNTAIRNSRKIMQNVSAMFIDDSSYEDLVPARLESDVSSDEESEGEYLPTYENFPKGGSRHEFTQSLKWEFKGLTIWIELEEFDYDITGAIHSMAKTHNVEVIPKSHMTAIYGMTHLSTEQAVSKMHEISDLFPQGWPKFDRPVGVVTDLAVAGRPGQVCSIAWAELTMSSNPHHEEALDKLYALFFPDEMSRPKRHRPWKPHNSIAYDNPEDNVLSLAETFNCVSRHPTLLTKERRVEAVSLWDTNGTMAEWKCIERVKFM